MHFVVVVVVNFYVNVSAWLNTGRQSKSTTKWSTRGPYDLTYSTCSMLTDHSVDTQSVGATSSCLMLACARCAQTSQSGRGLADLQLSLDDEAAMSTLPCMWRRPPVRRRSARHAVGQLSSLDGMRPRLTRSAQSVGQVSRLSPASIWHRDGSILFNVRLLRNASTLAGFHSQAMTRRARACTR